MNFHTEEKDILIYEKICRTCLSTYNLTPIIQEDSKDSISIFEKLMACTAVQVS